MCSLELSLLRTFITVGLRPMNVRMFFLEDSIIFIITQGNEFGKLRVALKLLGKSALHILPLIRTLYLYLCVFMCYKFVKKTYYLVTGER